MTEVVIDGRVMCLKSVLAHEVEPEDLFSRNGRWYVVGSVVSVVQSNGWRRTTVKLRNLDGTPYKHEYGAMGDVPVAVLREVSE